MKHRIITIMLLGLFVAPLAAQAVEEIDFEVRTTQNLLNLCSASQDDILYAEAINFCHGYLVGAYHYHEVSRIGPNADSEICVPVPAPSRNETVDLFIEWVKANPQHHNELPVEAQFRFLHETWLCD